MTSAGSLAALRNLVARVGRRQRLADAAWQLRRVGFPVGLLLLAVTTAGTRLLATPTSLGLIALLPTIAVVAWATFRRRDWRSDARQLDAHYALHDRIGNALEFSALTPPTDPHSEALVQAFIDDAVALGSDFDPRPVVPITLPQARRTDVMATLALLVAAFVPVPEPPLPHPNATVDPNQPATLAANEPTALPFAEALRRDLRELSKGDQATASLATAIIDVLAELERGDIDRLRALEMLDELDELLRAAEDEFQASVDEDPAMLAEAMRELAEQLSQHDITEQAGDALARQDVDDLQEQLDKAFERADSSSRDAKDMDRALKAAEHSLAQAAKQAAETQKQLNEAERRLRREQKQKSEDPQEQERRLRRQKEKLDELRRQHKREQAAARELERLRRQARNSQSQSGGQKSGQRNQKQRQQSRKDMSQGMANASKKARRARRLSSSRDALEQAKSLVRRAGNKGDQNKRRDDQRERFARAAKGKKNKKGEPSMLIEGDVGEPDSDGSMVMDDGGDQGSEAAPGDQPGDGDSQNSEPSDAPGDGMGDGSDDRLGPEVGRDVKARDHHATPQQGRGATRAEVIADASQEGFATEAYRRVFVDYRAFAQSSMDDESLPPAKRRQVRRYFQMIQPRDKNP